MKEMTKAKLNQSNMPISDYNVAVVSHYPTQQSAIIVNVKKPSVLNSKFNNFGISQKDNTIRMDAPCRRKKMRFYFLFLILLTLFLCSITGFFVMWFTEIYNNSIISSLVLSPNSTAVKWWKTPPLDPELRIHLFNYTNADRYIKGIDTKLIVEDLGPYVYIEKFEKVNVVFNDNKTISYQENRTFKFLAEKSKGRRQYDKIVFPNVALFAASSYARHLPMFKQLAINLLLPGTSPFKTLTAREFIWGYKEPVVKLRNQFGEDDMNDMFGMLMSRNGTSRDVITVFTGENDMQKLSIINMFNGESKMNFWSDDKCNQLDGTDGSQFPPHWMDKKTPLQVFIKAFCRKFPLVYDQEVNILNGIPAWRYKAPLDVFSHPDNNTANECYCDTKTNDCPPSGVFNASLCFNAPIFISFPHFLTGDSSLFKNIEGLKPDEQKHLTYADIHSRLAFPIDGASRFQINVQVQKAFWLTAMNPMQDGLYLPVLWMEVSSGELSEELRTMIYHSTFSANAIQLSLRYGSLLVCATILAMLFAAFLYFKRVNQNTETFT